MEGDASDTASRGAGLAGGVGCTGEAAMRRLVRLVLIALLVLLVVALAVGCAARRQVVRREGGAVAVRLPPAETVDIRVLREPADLPPPSQPPAVSDESKGRWLTLFEMDLAPSEAAGVPPAPAESP